MQISNCLFVMIKSEIYYMFCAFTGLKCYNINILYIVIHYDLMCGMFNACFMTSLPICVLVHGMYELSYTEMLLKVGYVQSVSQITFIPLK